MKLQSRNPWAVCVVFILERRLPALIACCFDRGDAR